MAGAVAYLDMDAAGLNDGTSWEDAYEDAPTWETNEAADLPTADYSHKVNIRASQGTADSVLEIVGTWVTDATHTITLDQFNNDFHGMRYDDQVFRFEGSPGAEQIDIRVPYVYLNGLQIYRLGNTLNRTGINAYHTTADGVVSLKNCLVLCDGLSTGNNKGFNCGSSGVLVQIQDSVFAGWSEYGIYVQYGSRPNALIYNTTVNNCGIGIDVANDADFTLKNNIVSSCTTDWSRVTGVTASNNSSSDGSHPGISSGVIGTPTYLDAANDDYHLAESDTAWHTSGLGTTDSTVLPTDPDGDARGVTTCSIGFDEYTTYDAPRIRSAKASVVQVYGSTGTAKLPKHDEGDGLLILAACDYDRTFNAVTGYTALGQASDPAGATLAAFYKEAGAGETDPTISITAGSEPIQAQVFRITGWNGNAPTVAFDSFGGTATPTAPTVTTTADNALVIRACAADDYDNGDMDTPATQILSTHVTASSSDVRLGSSKEIQSTAGATGTATFTLPGAIGEDGASVTIAFYPVAGGVSVSRSIPGVFSVDQSINKVLSAPFSVDKQISQVYSSAFESVMRVTEAKDSLIMSEQSVSHSLSVAFEQLVSVDNSKPGVFETLQGVSSDKAAIFSVDSNLIAVSRSVQSAYEALQGIAVNRSAPVATLAGLSVNKSGQLETVVNLVVIGPAAFEVLVKTESGYQATFEALKLIQKVGSVPFEFIGTGSAPTYEYFEMRLSDTETIALELSDLVTIN